MEVSSCANWELYSFNNCVSFVSICCFQLMMGWFESIWLYLFCCHFFSGNTMHCWCIWIFCSLWYFLYGWFQMAYIFSFVECDMFIMCNLTLECSQIFFTFYVVYAIYDVDIWIIFPFVESWLLIKYAICPLIVCPLVLIGMMPLCLGGILRVDLTIPIVAFCSQFQV